MIPWVLLDSTTTPDGKGELTLYQRKDEFSIRINHHELMNSRVHGSEEALAELSCAKTYCRRGAKVLIGGLGMGFTAAAALRHLSVDADITVAELIPAVVEWNRTHLGILASHPLKDKRINVRELDVADLIRVVKSHYDIIMLDIDNGPDALTQPENSWIYSKEGLRATLKSLRPGGVLAVWSIEPCQAFTTRLQQVGYSVEEKRVNARGSQGGGRHTIWVAQRPI